MPIAVTVSGGLFVTRASRLPGQFVAPGWRQSNALSIFHFLAWGLTPGQKFTKRGDDLMDSEICHPAKFHSSKPTNARYICYRNPADKQKTVTDISPACLSACGDNETQKLKQKPMSTGNQKKVRERKGHKLLSSNSAPLGELCWPFHVVSHTCNAII